MFDRIIEGLREVRADPRELTTRVGRLEREVAGMHGDLAELSTRVDRMGERIDRIEHRLDLRGAGAAHRPVQHGCASPVWRRR